MRRFGAAAALCVAALLGAEGARGELAQRGNLRIFFDADIAPRTLPRDRPAPVWVRLSGSLRTTDGSPPPPLRSVSVALNRHGRLSTRGLPTCPRGSLESTSSATALQRCDGALVGRGRFDARIDLPRRAPFAVRGRILAFNSRPGDRPAILLHVHVATPVRATLVLAFRISRRPRGSYGTVLLARIPKIASDLGYVTDISLRFGRTYRHRGARRSLLSASCPAPAGFPGAIFNLARGSFLFAGGKRLTATLVRDCRVR